MGEREVGKVEGGTPVTVFGKGFEGSGMLCGFGLAGRVEGRYVTSSQIVCASPGYAMGQEVEVEVSQNGADFTGSGMRYLYAGIPEVLSVSPSQSTVKGGGQVTILGRNFEVSSDVVWVRFGAMREVRAVPQSD